MGFKLKDLMDLTGLVLLIIGIVLNSNFENTLIPYVFIGFGLILIVLYIGSYLKVNYLDGIRKNARNIKNIANVLDNLKKDINTQKDIILLREEMSYMKGMLSKNKKGVLDPISLIVVLILLTLFIQWLKLQGIL